jgi:hypothetical protein
MSAANDGLGGLEIALEAAGLAQQAGEYTTFPVPGFTLVVRSTAEGVSIEPAKPKDDAS